MKMILAILAALCTIAFTSGETRIYDFTAESNSGHQVNFADYKGKVLLIVNTASNPDSKWNFTKFLIDRKGRVVVRFEPIVKPEDLEAEINVIL